MSLLHLLLQTDFGLYSDYNKDPGQEKKICQTNLSRQYHILDLQYFPTAVQRKYLRHDLN